MYKRLYISILVLICIKIKKTSDNLNSRISLILYAYSRLVVALKTLVQG